MSKLIRHNAILFISEPFGDFNKDCETCEQYLDSGNMSEGGKCKLHNISCGYGFTCKDYKKNMVCGLNKPHIDFEE